MATGAEKKQALEAWREHCRDVQSMTDVSGFAPESVVQRERRINRLRANYAAFCEYYFPHYLQQRDKASGEVLRMVHNAAFHNDAARIVRSTPNLKAVFKWPRGHAKSTHFDIFIPLWLMFQTKRLVSFVVVAGKSEDAATRLLGDIQAELEYNKRLIADFGKQRGAGDWQDGEFKSAAGVKFLAVGRGQSPRGLRDREARPDYIVIDDLDDDELCRNPDRVERMTEWVREALFGALDVGRGRFIMVGNLISKTSVLANIAATKGVYVSEVKAVDGNGDPVWREKWTREEAEAVQLFMGYRAWQKEMMHNPIVSGKIFKNEWIRYHRVLPLGKYVSLICYTDPSFKSTGNDYKASVLMGRKPDGDIDIIDCMVRQCSVAEMVRWQYNLYERVCLVDSSVAVRFMMEANFMQDILLDDFDVEGNRRGYRLPLTGDMRKKPDKLARIETMSPLWERGTVWYNEALRDTPDMTALVEQTLAVGYGSGAHDDGPDACEGGIWYLQRSARQVSVKPVVGPRRRPKNCW